MTGYLSKPPPGVQLNRNHPLAQGLVGCWLFNEGAGIRANDLSGNDNAGTLTNMAVNSPTSGWGGSSLGTALNFDGVDDYIKVPSASSLNNINATLTIEAWINFQTVTEIRAIVDKYVGGLSYWALYIKNTQNVLFQCRDSALLQVSLTSDNSISPNRFHHLVGVRGNRKFYIYIDGVLATAPVTDNIGNISTTGDMAIGKQLSGSAYQYKGQIQSVRIWNRALSAQEIQQLYAQPFAMFNFKHLQY